MLGSGLCLWCDRTHRQILLPARSPTIGICPTCLLTHFGLTPDQLDALALALNHRRWRHRYEQHFLPLRPTKWT